MAILTKKQLTNYAADGFLVLKDFITPATCEQLTSHAKHLINQFDPNIKTIFSGDGDGQHTKADYFLNSGDKVHFFFEKEAFDNNGQLKFCKEKSINKIGHALHELDPLFTAFCQSEKFVSLAKALQLHNPLLIQSMYICKQPFIGGEVMCHQDGTYLHSQQETITGLWIALEDATEENGCLWAIPGGHIHPLKSRSNRNDKNEIQTEIFDSSAWPSEAMVPLEVTRGSLIVLHSRVPHMSYENKSKNSRHAFTLHIMDGRDTFLNTNWLRRAAHMPFQGFYENRVSHKSF